MNKALTLPGDVSASLVVCEHSKDSYINYRRDFRIMENRRTVELFIEQRVRADYQNGELIDTLNVTYHIVNPAKLGKKLFAGVDISPNSKVFLDIVYQRAPDGTFSIHTIHKRATLVFERQTNGDNLPMQPVDSPLHILDTIARIDNIYNIPFALFDATNPEFIRVSQHLK